MFGYVRLYKPTVRMGEYEQYRGVYCTLCRRLGRLYGIGARMTLSYDMTFLALVRLALAQDGPDFCKGRCDFNPGKRCLRCRNVAAVDYAADIGILLTAYKLRDTLADDRLLRRIGAAILYPVAALRRRKAARRQPDAAAVIDTVMADQRTLEAEHCASLDRAADPTARLLGFLLRSCAEDPAEQRVLERFGYFLGRWIYLTDAADDADRDHRNGNYNPYISSGILQFVDKKAVKEGCLPSLNACLAECAAAYGLLTVRRFGGILSNIVEQGLPAMQKQVTGASAPTDNSAVTDGGMETI